MPKKGPLPGKKKQPLPPPSDDDSSVDSKGNVRDLIDYDYSESSEDRPVRSSAKKARKNPELLPFSRSNPSGPSLNNTLSKILFVFTVFS